MNTPTKNNTEIEAIMARPGVETRLSKDGHTIIKSIYPLGEYAVSVPSMLKRCAATSGDTIWLAERPERPITDAPWREITYKEGAALASRIGQGLLGLIERRDQPILCLSDNTIEFGVFMAGVMETGITYSAVTPAYGYSNADLSRLRHIVDVLNPCMVYVEDGDKFNVALQQVISNVPVIAAKNPMPGHLTLQSLKDTVAGTEVEEAYQRVGPDTVAKIMFTSGSTGPQKGVIIPHRMLCSNMAASAKIWPFMEDHPTVLLDWLPWSHSMGGNHNFDIPLFNSGTLYIDAGKPTESLFEQTLINYRDVSPTYVVNVPLAYQMLVNALETDSILAENFFKRLDVMYYASASLPQHIWDRLQALADKSCGRQIPMLSGWGGTEMGPSGTKVHWLIDKAGMIGAPLPGTEVKLTPVGERFEMRMRGPNVTPGYLGMPEKTIDAFDEESFYKSGDAGELIDPDRPELGLAFKGRISENFKLVSGAWVDVGELRLAVIAAASKVVKDAVIAGHDRDDIGVLVVPNIEGCRELAGDKEGELTIEQLIQDDSVGAALESGLRMHNSKNRGSSRKIGRAMILSEAPDFGVGEITDKGYINQRMMLDRRASDVEQLYSSLGNKRFSLDPNQNINL